MPISVIIMSSWTVVEAGVVAMKLSVASLAEAVTEVVDTKVHEVEVGG